MVQATTLLFQFEAWACKEVAQMGLGFLLVPDVLSKLAQGACYMQVDCIGF